MKTKTINLYYLITILLVSVSCTSEKIEFNGALSEEDYYPLEVNRNLRYIVQNIELSNFGSDTIDYFLEEKTVSIEETGENRALERTALISSNSTGETTKDPGINKIYTSTITNDRIIRNEDNLRFIDLELPVSVGNQHNENFFQVNAEEQTLEIVSIGEDYELPDTTYENCLVIRAQEENNAIIQYQYEKVYQLEVGLVYFKLVNTSQQPGQPRLGQIFEQRLLNAN